jgi:tRNA pseudouridine32 synthase / 23S rRNA pseudouridine746 synthase
VPSVQRLLEQERGEKLFVVHRLDKEVSGLLVFARDAATHRTLSMAFEQRRVHKTYLALAHGLIAKDVTIDKPIAEFGSGRMAVDERRGKPSRTEVHVVDRYARHTLLEAHPITGRRHQLRVHLYSIGHALSGDPRYGDLNEQAKWPRLMLHALRVVLPDNVTIECPPPPSFQDVLSNSTLVPR